MILVALPLGTVFPWRMPVGDHEIDDRESKQQKIFHSHSRLVFSSGHAGRVAGKRSNLSFFTGCETARPS
jgi:hypothetical protein